MNTMIALHHRRIRGEALTAEESAALEKHLADCDAQEAVQFSSSLARAEQERQRHEEKQQKQNSLLAREEAVAHRLRGLLEEANAIRREWHQAA